MEVVLLGTQYREDRELLKDSGMRDANKHKALQAERGTGKVDCMNENSNGSFRVALEKSVFLQSRWVVKWLIAV